MTRGLQSAWSAWRAARRELGPRLTWVYLAARLFEKASLDRVHLHPFIVVGQPVRSRPQLPARIGSDIDVSEVTPGDPICAEFPRTAATWTKHFDQGARCLAATRAGSFLGYHWLIPGQYQEDQFFTRIELLPTATTAWNFDLFVAPAHRLGPAFLRLWDASHAMLTAMGARWVLSRISPLNTASVRAHERMGAVRIGWILYLTFADWQLMVSSAAPLPRLTRRRGCAPLVRWRAPVDD